jgi:hypothetical protein
MAQAAVVFRIVFRIIVAAMAHHSERRKSLQSRGGEWVAFEL